MKSRFSEDCNYSELVGHSENKIKIGNIIVQSYLRATTTRTTTRSRLNRQPMPGPMRVYTCCATRKIVCYIRHAWAPVGQPIREFSYLQSRPIRRNFSRCLFTKLLFESASPKLREEFSSRLVT